VALATVALTFAPSHPANPHQPHKHRLGQHFTVSSTCYAQSGQTASGQQTRPGIVANNFLPLGTKVTLDRPEFGRRLYRVEDRIGYGSQLDLYNPSELSCIAYGRRELGFRVVLRPH
jgi:3D (Asp-Asp-Asp) domain-containing protein